jgi:hypothetical protein
MSMNVFARIIPENGPVGMAIPSGAPGASIAIISFKFEVLKFKAACHQSLSAFQNSQ